MKDAEIRAINALETAKSQFLICQAEGFRNPESCALLIYYKIMAEETHAEFVRVTRQHYEALPAWKRFMIKLIRPDGIKQLYKGGVI